MGLKKFFEDLKTSFIEAMKMQCLCCERCKGSGFDPILLPVGKVSVPITCTKCFGRKDINPECPIHGDKGKEALNAN